jgi:hypothetical protein
MEILSSTVAAFFESTLPSKFKIFSFLKTVRTIVSRILKVYIKTTLMLTIECDEAWSFVGKSNHKQWIWLALDRDSREVIGYYIGDRSTNGAKGLWATFFVMYRE